MHGFLVTAFSSVSSNQSSKADIGALTWDSADVEAAQYLVLNSQPSA